MSVSVIERILQPAFFARPTLAVSEELLGKHLVCKTEKGIYAGFINEVEAYVGPEDKACHAHRGLTPRTSVMFGPPGYWYVYLIYGMYWMLNIVTERDGYPAAVLIRGVGDFNGPGKLTKSLGITGSLNGKIATQSSGLWIEDRGEKVERKNIKSTPRIGVEYAQEWAKKPYRFLL